MPTSANAPVRPIVLPAGNHTAAQPVLMSAGSTFREDTAVRIAAAIAASMIWNMDGGRRKIQTRLVADTAVELADDLIRRLNGAEGPPEEESDDGE